MTQEINAAGSTRHAGGVFSSRLRTAGIVLAGAAGVWAVAHAGGFGDLAVLTGPWLLYNRLDRSATLTNATRRRIFEYVQRMPAACIADIASEVGVSHSTASYHLDKLCAFSLVTGTTDGNKVRFFVNGGAFTDDERRILAVLDNPETRRVLVTILRHPWSYRAELTTLLGVSSPTVNWHLQRLGSCELVGETRNGRSRFLTADATRLVRVLTGLEEKLVDTGYDVTGLRSVLDACRAGVAPAAKAQDPART